MKVIARCVQCGREKEISEGEVKEGDQPMCDKCYMPMIAKEVIK